MWNVTANDEEKLLLIKSDSTLNNFNIQNILHDIYVKGQGKYSSYSRLIDLTALTDIDANFDLIRDQVQWYRSANQVEADFKIAMYMPFGILQSFIDVYLQEVEDRGNRLLLSDSLDECAEYLSVDKELLQF